MTSVEEERRNALGLAAQLLERLRDPALRELEVRQGAVRVRVAKGGAATAEAARRTESADVAPPAPGAADTAPPVANASAKAVPAPLTGIFYRSPSPQAPPFVQVGSVISVGDVIGLIEAMKLFNEVRSTIAGRVARILAESGELVRAHHPLIEIE